MVFKNLCILVLFHETIFPNFSFLGVSVSDISEERTCLFFSYLIFTFYLDLKF